MSEKEKIMLNEEELSGVSGGVKIRAGAVTNGTNSQDKTEALEKHFCKKCNRDTEHVVYSGTRAVCKYCNTPFTFI